MASVTSRRGRPHALADCLDCGERGPIRDNPETQRRWAVRHAERNPGHTVHLVTETVRVYRAEPTDG